MENRIEQLEMASSCKSARVIVYLSGMKLFQQLQLQYQTIVHSLYQLQLMEDSQRKLVFRYVVSPGNNATAIEKALKKRNIWQPIATQKEFLSACFLWKQLNYPSKVYEEFEQILKSYPNRHVLLNHFEQNSVITTKSGLLKTLKYYFNHELALTDKVCHIHDIIPTSFIIHAHKEDTQYRDFVEKFHHIEKKNFHKEKIPEKHCEKNVWFIKPESDNQGKGIMISNNFKEIESFLISKPINTGWIVQKAIEKPLLYHGRKFDIRVWVLVTPNFEIYYYNSPYMRTSSTMYTTDSMNTEIHLTNNCQQKHFTQYSKFEEGNTIPMRETLLRYIDPLEEGEGRSQNIVSGIISKMKEIIIDSLMSAKKYFMRGLKKKEFELFGYDFLIDQDFRTWLLEVNNNPYLGVPNNFIKQLLPLMIDEMMEIIIDPLFPPQSYVPVERKRFQIIYRQSGFRLSPIRIVSNSNDTKYTGKRQKSFSKQNSIIFPNPKSEIYSITLKEDKTLQPIYSTPTETIKHLLDTYCFSDLDPFLVPVTLILRSPALEDGNNIETSLKKLKLITETRISKILLETKPFQICCNLLTQDKYSQRVKAKLIQGFTNSCKSFKSRIFILKNLVPLVNETVRMYKNQIEEEYVEAIMKLLISAGGYFDRTIFIPGQSRENQFAREVFIRSNSFKLLLFLKKKFPKIANNETTVFLQNFTDKDWELFYETSGNKIKRSYSPKVNTAPENEEELIVINSNSIHEQKPKVMSLRQNAEIKNFRTRKHSKKE